MPTPTRATAGWCNMPNRMYPSATMPTLIPAMATGSKSAAHNPDAAGMTNAAATTEIQKPKTLKPAAVADGPLAFSLLAR